ncbi:hypothetical protein [Ktedonospora formicarum]|uniref:Tyr recombinase domain-containing protein n=1 Tax=Ktedonospora formicarum TaxID=2778364 RepID=A0A8J3IGX9_9CHLR|nr:hypothetical protein [Ktedonospora formicarum]GHO50964.1 hypothetical protein KSX_91270 [Ktedonospora formicarum]
MLSLRWHDLNGETRVLSILRTRNSLSEKVNTEEEVAPSLQRRIKLPPSLLEALLRHQEEQREMFLAESEGWSEKGLIFSTAAGGPLSPAHLRQDLLQVCREAEVPLLSLHDVRNNTTCILFSLGVDPRVW